MASLFYSFHVKTEVLKKAPTIYDVAAEAGVSKSLVSLVLRGDAKVSDSKRESVMAAMEKLHFRPSRTAQLLASKTSKTVGVIITEYKNLSYVSVLRGLREVFDEVGIQVLLSDLHRRSDFAQDPVDAFLSMNVDGLVLVCEPEGLRTAGVEIPMVLVGDRATSVPGADWVSNDDKQGMTQLLNHVYDLGHREIVHITGAGGIAKVRSDIYEEFMLKRRLTSQIFGAGNPTSEIGGYLAAKELVNSGKEFTAIVAANDYMAAGAISAMLEEGLSVPDDISVAGYDNSPISSEYLLKLTTIDEEGALVGRKAVELLLSRFSQSAPSGERRVRVKPTFIGRDSTKQI